MNKRIYNAFYFINFPNRDFFESTFTCKQMKPVNDQI